MKKVFEALEKVIYSERRRKKKKGEKNRICAEKLYGTMLYVKKYFFEERRKEKRENKAFDFEDKM